MPLSAGAGDQAAQLLDDRGCRRRRLAGRVHKPVELVVQVAGLRTGLEREGNAVLAGRRQVKVCMRDHL